MGKIRVKTLDQEQEERDKKLKAKREGKKAEKKASEEPVIEAENKQLQSDAPLTEIEKKSTSEVSKKETKTKKGKFKKEAKASRSARYQRVFQTLDRNKKYSLSEALEILPKLATSKFDETVELHINTIETGINGSITLPHGTGKQIKVAIANDSLIQDILDGKINFDILLAEPAMMPKLAKVARVLGPKGLMPNPKNGTITPKPEEAAKKYEGGLMNFKTEAKAPIMHLTIGKVSFGKEKLTDNINAMFKAVKKSNIRTVTLKSTMSPGIKVQV